MVSHTIYDVIQQEIDAVDLGGMANLPKVVTAGKSGSGKNSIFNFLFSTIKQDGLTDRSSTVPLTDQSNSNPAEFSTTDSNTSISTERFFRQVFISNSALIQLSVVQVSSQVDLINHNLDISRLIENTNVFAYVVDCTKLNEFDMGYFSRLLDRLYRINPQIHIAVFFHKTDLVAQRIKNHLTHYFDKRFKEMFFHTHMKSLKIECYVTSIKDNTIYYAYSRMLFNFIPNINVINNLLKVFATRCSIDYLFIFDLNSYLCVGGVSKLSDFGVYCACLQSLKFANCVASNTNCGFSSFDEMDSDSHKTSNKANNTNNDDAIKNNSNNNNNSHSVNNADDDNDDDFEKNFSPNYMYIDVNSQYYSYSMEIDRFLFIVAFAEKQSNTLSNSIHNNLRELCLVLRKTLPARFTGHPKTHTTLYTPDIGKVVTPPNITSTNFNLY